MIIIYFKRITDKIYNKEITNPNLLNYKSDKVQETKKRFYRIIQVFGKRRNIKKKYSEEAESVSENNETIKQELQAFYK